MRSGRIDVARPRVCAALAASRAAVCALVAPPGSGKTTALQEYARTRQGAVYLRVPNGATKAEMLRLLHGTVATEIVLDDADGASRTGIEALLAEIETMGSDSPRYILSGVSRSRLSLRRLLCAGAAEYFDASFLAFDRDEIVAFAELLGVRAEPSDVEQLLYDTDGWAVAVSLVVRDAARHSRLLRGAFEIWREHNDYLLLEFVTEAARDEAASRTFRAILNRRYEGDPQEALLALEGAGYPVVRTRTDLRPYRVLLQLAAPQPRPQTTVASGIVSLTLFGRFACTISGRPIAFPRRREQNVLAYIALSPGASVSRSELMHTFWPDVPSAVASQGLRTTLSRLRKTIAEASGDNAGRYVRIEPAMISLSLDHVTIDARRFADHVEQGKLADARGDVAGCREHFRIAERIYANTLLAAEAVEPALAPRVADYASMFEAILRRLVELHLSAADVASADSCARRLAEESAHHSPWRSSFRLALASQPL